VADAVDPAARPGDGAAQAAGVAQLAGGDADQRDQVVGLPEPVDVGLAEAGAAAQDAAPGRRVVDGERGAQLGVRRAEPALAARLAQVDAAAANASEGPGDGGAGEPVT
jgi:hypothetical protein